METKNQTAQESAQSGVVDYAAALRQYHRYGWGRSMKKFCEDEVTQRLDYYSKTLHSCYRFRCTTVTIYIALWLPFLLHFSIPVTLGIQ